MHPAVDLGQSRNNQVAEVGCVVVDFGIVGFLAKPLPQFTIRPSGAFLLEVE